LKAADTTIPIRKGRWPPDGGFDEAHANSTFSFNSTFYDRRMGDVVHTVLSGQFHRGLPLRLRQPRPRRLGAPKLLHLALQLRHWLWNRCACRVHYQPHLGD
jgi:hypothetical protein